MNQSQAKEYLPIIRAWADGSVIQINIGQVWEDARIPDFSLGPECYRIKPEPKLKPWNEHTFPIYCVLMHQKGNMIYRPCSWDSRGVLIVFSPIGSTNFNADSHIVKWEALAASYKYSTNGFNWHPCGIIDNA